MLFQPRKCSATVAAPLNPNAVPDKHGILKRSEWDGDPQWDDPSGLPLFDPSGLSLQHAGANNNIFGSQAFLYEDGLDKHGVEAALREARSARIYLEGTKGKHLDFKMRLLAGRETIFRERKLALSKMRDRWHVLISALEDEMRDASTTLLSMEEQFVVSGDSALSVVQTNLRQLNGAITHLDDLLDHASTKSAREFLGMRETVAKMMSLDLPRVKLRPSVRSGQQAGLCPPGQLPSYAEQYDSATKRFRSLYLASGSSPSSVPADIFLPPSQPPGSYSVVKQVVTSRSQRKVAAASNAEQPRSKSVNQRSPAWVSEQHGTIPTRAVRREMARQNRHGPGVQIYVPLPPSERHSDDDWPPPATASKPHRIVDDQCAWQVEPRPDTFKQHSVSDCSPIGKSLANMDAMMQWAERRAAPTVALPPSSSVRPGPLPDTRPQSLPQSETQLQPRTTEPTINLVTQRQRNPKNRAPLLEPQFLEGLMNLLPEYAINNLTAIPSVDDSEDDFIAGLKAEVGE